MALHKLRKKRQKITDSDYLAAQIVAHGLNEVLCNIGAPRMYLQSFVREFWFWSRDEPKDETLKDIFRRLHLLILQNGIHHVSFQEPLVPRFRKIHEELLAWLRQREQILRQEQKP